MNKDENKDKFDILRFISKKPEISQRKLSKELGLSLGKLNYCLKELKKRVLSKFKTLKIINKKFNTYTY